MQAFNRIRAFTLIEMLFVMAIICVLTAVAIPNLLETRKAVNERAAVSTMRDIVTAQEIFRNCRLGSSPGYGTLQDLASTPVGSVQLLRWPDPARVGYRNLYHFEQVEDPTKDNWCIRASPETFGLTGDSYFAAVEDGIIRTGTSQPSSRADVIAMKPI